MYAITPLNNKKGVKMKENPTVKHEHECLISRGGGGKKNRKDF